MSTLGITGQRTYSPHVGPVQRDFGFRKTHAGVKWFKDQGFSRVISGMAQGVDQWAATAALLNQMELIAALPFEAEDQSRRWNEQDRETYRNLLVAAAHVWICPPQPHKLDGYAIRNQWIVEHADAMLVVTSGSRRGGTWDCIGRVANADKPGVLVHTTRKAVTTFTNGLELADALAVPRTQLAHAA